MQIATVRETMPHGFSLLRLIPGLAASQMPVVYDATLPFHIKRNEFCNSKQVFWLTSTCMFYILSLSKAKLCYYTAVS